MPTAPGRLPLNTRRDERIRRLVAQGYLNQADAAREYGLTDARINQIIRRDPNGYLKQRPTPGSMS